MRKELHLPIQCFLLLKFLEFLLKFPAFLLKSLEFLLKFPAFILKFLAFILKFLAFMLKFLAFLFKFLAFVMVAECPFHWARKDRKVEHMMIDRNGHVATAVRENTARKAPTGKSLTAMTPPALSPPVVTINAPAVVEWSDAAS
ncbi:hypothetical protein LA080_011823 [Diaporthe eres]|nr:hypothetical protein LA080_011823 [Diaporthe eres]